MARAITVSSCRSYSVRQIFRASHGFGDSFLAQRRGLEHGESRVLQAGRRFDLKLRRGDADNNYVKLFRRRTLNITRILLMYLQRAQRAINTSHVEAESKENGIGFVKLMSVTMRWMLHKLADMSTLLLSQHFILKEKDGFLEYIEKRIKVNGHMVRIDVQKHGI
ncbi:unnamed protein product [Brassica oleracea]